MSQIEIENLNVFYGNRQILKNINLSIKSQKITSLIGESGSGKSTIIKSILGMISKKNGYSLKGKITLNSKEINPTKALTIQPVFQDPTLYFNPSWKMKDCLLEPFSLRGIPEKIAYEKIFSSLDFFSMSKSNLENRSGSFSGGELQRLSILRAVFFEPEVLLMDEPVSGLDRLILSDTIDFLKKLKESQDLTIFIVSHDLEFIETISEYVYIIYNGEIVEFGKTEFVLKNPRENYTKNLLKSRDLSGIKI